MYRNITKYHLRYTDVDAFDRAKLSTILSFLEESACYSADELGFGYNVLAPKNLGFIIVNLYIEFEGEIKLGEDITVHTWPIKPRHSVFFRDSELYVNDKKVGVATARWFMIDTKTYSLMPSSAHFDDSDFDNYNTERSIDFAGWKIAPQTSAKYVYTKTAEYSDYDHYFHVNNTKYADFLMDAFTVDELAEKSLKSVQITYVKQCKIGEKIDVYRHFLDGYYYIEGRVENELRVQMKVKLV
jgi:acyl-ACP thioesterase